MMVNCYTAYIGVGANLGDPIQQIVDARMALRNLPETQSLRTSSLYYSKPVGYADQANFVNAVFEVVTSMEAYNLFAGMQKIELALGRQRDANNQNAPRVIDLDLLLFADQVIDDERLVVPHPRMSERSFVLKPLAELAPKLATKYGASQDFPDQVLHRLIV